MTPLIYTKNGNVPMDSLTMHVEWTEAEEWIKCREYWTDSTGDIVKDGAHVYVKKGIELKLEAGTF
jgi:hypothetical protein